MQWRSDVRYTNGPVCARADPTQAGEAVLDAFHPYGRVKRLRNRPVHAFEGDDLWLRVAAAEKESLISVRIQARAPFFLSCIIHSIAKT